MSERLSREKSYTFDDWLKMDHNENIELIEGSIYMMSEPSRRHQKVARELTVELGNFLRGKKCWLYYDPFMVRLNKKTVVHPDISVICDTNKLNDRGCVGAPDLIIEILSPSNAGHDIFTKYNQYLMAGVKEYWIVDPYKNTVTVYILQNNDYQVQLYSEEDILPVSVLPDCRINLKIIFEKEE